MSFRVKTILGIAVIQSIVLLGLIWNSTQILTVTSEQELLKRSATTLTLFASSIRDAILGMDIGALESQARSILSNSGVVYVRVLDAQGTVLAEAGDADALGHRFVPDYQLENVSHGVFNGFSDVLIAGKKYGRVEIGISVLSVQAGIQKARNQSFMFAGLILGLVTIFSTFLVLYLTRGLDALKVATRRIAAGDFGYQTIVTGTDELAQTARSFNEMSAQIRETYDERRRAEISVLEEHLDKNAAQITLLNREVAFLTFNDPLTKIPNRTLFKENLHQAFLGLSHHKAPFAVFQINLQNFRVVNSAYGFDVGDAVLRELAARLSSIAGEAGNVARLGGDEFALLMPAINDSDTAAELAKRIVSTIAAPVVIGAQMLRVKASVGIALAPLHGNSAEELLRNVDAALSEAMQTRGDYICFRGVVSKRA